MATTANRDHDQDMLEVASRMESSKLSRRPSRNSSSQTPKRRSARIEKPRSSHQSPRTLERRRTLTAVRQYATLDDHYRKMFGLDAEDDEEDTENRHDHHTTRPVSWHPSSSQWLGSDFTGSGSGSLQWQHHDTQETSRSDESGMPYSQAEPYSSTVDSEFPHQYMGPGRTELRQIVTDYASNVDAAWSSYVHGHSSGSTTTQSNASAPHQITTWLIGSQPQYEDNTLTYLPADEESQLIPTQSYATEEQDWKTDARHRLTRKKSAELIGLGLYDPPGSTPVPLHTDGKGLKLEETWQPPEEMEDADADEESEDEEDEPPRPEDSRFTPAALPLVNMSGQSFLFEEDEGLKNEWWYHHLKNTMPQDGTLGYGWI